MYYVKNQVFPKYLRYTYAAFTTTDEIIYLETMRYCYTRYPSMRNAISLFLNFSVSLYRFAFTTVGIMKNIT